MSRVPGDIQDFREGIGKKSFVINNKDARLGIRAPNCITPTALALDA
jgi:hypothetical protein